MKRKSPVAVMMALAALVGVTVVGPVLSPPAAAAVSIQADQDVEYVTAGITIKASYRAPASGATRVPAAVIVGGSGDVDRDGNGSGVATEDYRWIADRLSAQGVASIRYDKVGTGATGVGPYTSDPSPMLGLSYDQLRVQPARDALAFLARQPGIDPSRLLVFGHSEGGMIGLAIDRDPGTGPRPAGLALIEPNYGPILDVFGRQYTDQIQAGVQDGEMTGADAATLTAWMQAAIDEIRTGTPPYPDPGPVPLPGATDFTAVFQSAILSNFYGSDPLQMVLDHAFRTLYGKDQDAIDLPTLASSVRVPTLITCGTKDFNTPCVPGGPPGSGVSALAGAFPPGVAHFVAVPNMVHILRDVGNDNPVDLPTQLAYPFSAVLAIEIEAFAASFVAAPPTTTTSLTPTTTNPSQAVAATPTFTG